MNAAWFLWYRQTRSAMRFWISITGYDIRDRSQTGRLYLLYLVIFFGLWGLAVLALFSSAAALGLQQLSTGQPAWIASIITAIFLLLWWVWRLVGASRRSPVRFTPEDAALICATPISRPYIVLFWFVREWFTTALFFWGIAIVLGFALAEIALERATFWGNLYTYLGFGLRFLLPVLFIHTGMLAITWALGCYRLHGDQERRYVVWISLIFGLLVIPGFFLIAFQQTGLNFLLNPLLVPLQAGSGLGDFFPGIIIAVSWMAAGGVALFRGSQLINLSRAAHETEATSQLIAATLMGNPRLSESIRLKGRLRDSSPPIRLPNLTGETAILWKQAIQSIRGLSLNHVSDWFLVFGISLAVIVAPDWGSRGMLILFLVIKVLGQTTKGFQFDLGNWTIYQSLPFKLVPRLIFEIIPPVIATTVLGWAALIICHFWGLMIIPLEIYPILPFLVLPITFIGIFDVIRQSRGEYLLMGKIPEPGMISVLLSAATIVMNLILLLVFRKSIMGLFCVLMLSLFICYGVIVLCSRSYRQLSL